MSRTWAIDVSTRRPTTRTKSKLASLNWNSRPPPSPHRTMAAPGHRGTDSRRLPPGRTTEEKTSLACQCLCPRYVPEIDCGLLNIVHWCCHGTWRPCVLREIRGPLTLLQLFRFLICLIRGLIYDDILSGACARCGFVLSPGIDV